MLEALIGIVIEILLEVFLQFIAEFVLMLGFEAIKSAVGRRRRANPIVGGIGLILVGSLVGVASAWLVPRRVLPPMPHLPGASLVLAPLGTGLAMHFVGERRRRRGAAPSLLATFWGGALLAFAMALARWLALAR